MTILIGNRTIYQGSITPTALNTETTIIEVADQAEPNIVEGYLDLSNLQDEDVLIVKEYINVDGENLRLYAQATYSGAQAEPIIRFHSKTFQEGYKVTITQTSGTLRSIKYWFLRLEYAVA
ncbi:hypothetical protein KEJ20_03040 [Candidatus Bathyarchaeota archaeon]|nr:hypothetical protein [Candidatus Bathyarchaeota archaeon]